MRIRILVVGDDEDTRSAGSGIQTLGPLLADIRVQVPPVADHTGLSSLTPPDSGIVGVDSPLTARQQEVVRLVIAGRSNDEIGRDLSVSRKTVETHLARMFARFGVATRTELAVRAERGGWLTRLPMVSSVASRDQGSANNRF